MGSLNRILPGTGRAGAFEIQYGFSLLAMTPGPQKPQLNQLIIARVLYGTKQINVRYETKWNDLNTISSARLAATWSTATPTARAIALTAI